MKKNKRGWIRIVEAFMALLLVSGSLLYLIEKNTNSEEDISGQVYEIQKSVLREIELNNELRNEILQTEKGIESSDNNFPERLNDKFEERIPEYLNCSAKICEMNNRICEITTYVDKNVYAQSVPITSNLTRYDPKQVKLFCWVK